MSQSSGDLHWDTTDMKVQLCDLVTATSRGEHVVLHFGARAADEVQVQAFGARLTRSIALRPASARHLRDMLAQVAAEDGGRHG